MPSFDVILRNAVVVDGTGADRFSADIGVTGDRITAVESLGDAVADLVIDVEGSVVTPGFIDVHNHSEGWLLKLGHLTCKTLQGFTTEVLMSDGISYAPVTPETAPHWIRYLWSLDGLTDDDYTGWHSLADYLQLFEQPETRIAQNVATQIPYANLRAAVMGWGPGDPSADQMREIQSMIEEGMAAGAVGVSTGLDYIAQFYSSEQELATAFQAMAPKQGIYATHIRYQLGVPAAVDEAARIAEAAGVGLHVSHLRAESLEAVGPIMEAVDRAAARVPFTFDSYPYGWGSTMVNMLLPYATWNDGPLAVAEKLTDPSLRNALKANLETSRFDARIVRIVWLPSEQNRGYIGSTLAEYAAAVDKPVEAAVCDLLIEENLAVLAIYERGDERAAEPFISHPNFILGSDGIYTERGLPHPRVFGAAARLMGRYVREKQVLSLESAVHHSTGYSAQRFGLTDRGEIRPDAYADLVVFDPDTFLDNGVYTQPNQRNTGLEHVFVNGQQIVASGEPVKTPRADLPGRVLHYHG